MTGAQELRSAITGLVGFAAAEEQMLLAAAPAAEPGDPRCWAALPLIAHNTEFKLQQVRRLQAVRLGQVPPEFAEVDHASAETYRGYEAPSAGEVAEASSRVAGELVDALNVVTDDDLDVAARVPAGQLRGGLVVDLQSGQPPHPVPQPLGGRAGPRADLEHVAAEVGVLGQGRQDLALDVRGPLGARAHPSMVLIHRPDATDGPGLGQERRLPSCVAGRTICRE